MLRVKTALAAPPRAALLQGELEPEARVCLTDGPVMGSHPRSPRSSSFPDFDQETGRDSGRIY